MEDKYISTKKALIKFLSDEFGDKKVNEVLPDIEKAFLLLQNEIEVGVIDYEIESNLLINEVLDKQYLTINPPIRASEKTKEQLNYIPIYISGTIGCVSRWGFMKIFGNKIGSILNGIFLIRKIK